MEKLCFPTSTLKRIRTSDLLVRNELLYPAELPGLALPIIVTLTALPRKPHCVWNDPCATPARYFDLDSSAALTLRATCSANLALPAAL